MGSWASTAQGGLIGASAVVSAPLPGIGGISPGRRSWLTRSERDSEMAPRPAVSKMLLSNPSLCSAFIVSLAGPLPAAEQPDE